MLVNYVILQLRPQALVQSIAITCQSVSPYQMPEFYEMFCKYYLWSWLSPSGDFVKYVLYFRFCG